MINITLFKKIGTHLKIFFSKIYRVCLLDPTKMLTLIQIKLVLLKNLSKQWIEMAMTLSVPALAIFCQI